MSADISPHEAIEIMQRAGGIMEQVPGEDYFKSTKNEVVLSVKAVSLLCMSGAVEYFPRTGETAARAILKAMNRWTLN